MKCYICDRDLSPDEIKLNPRIKDHANKKQWDPCGTCLEVIKDAFEHDSEEEIEEALDNATVESLYALPDFEEIP